MSEESGAAGVAPGRPTGVSAPARLVDPLGLGPRRGESGGLVRSVVPVFRFVNGWISRYFGAVLVLMIVVAIGVTYLNGGFPLMDQQLRNALVLGAIYALVAIGYTMVYGIIELINFAHGDVFTASGFYAIFIANTLHLNSLATSSFGGLVVALLIVFALSMLAAG